MTAFDRPREVEETTNEFFEENNPIAVWLKKTFDCNADQSCTISPSEMTALYNRENPSKQLTSARFGSFMSALGFHIKKSNGKTLYRGFRLREGECLLEE